MSKIDDLIFKYCPNGVERWLLGDLEDQKIIQLGRGNVISKTDLRDNPGEYPVYSSSATGNGILGFYSEYMFEDERLSWSIDGGGRFFYRPEHKYSITNVCGWLKVLQKDRLSTKYLFYALTNEWIKKIFDYTKKAHPSVIRKEYIVPIPPLPVQEEIVKILDSFTELEANLEANLEAELKARKKQHEHYRDELLNPENMKGEVKTMTLADIAPVLRGKRLTKSQLIENGDYPVFHGGIEPLGFYNQKNRDGNSVMVINVGASAGTVGFSPIDFWSSDGCFTIGHTDVCLSKYLYYVLVSKEKLLKSKVRVAGIPTLDNAVVEKIQIPVPSLEEQERIVSILDKFDALINDISKVLPVEINARRQQYEYYRDKLLNFEPIAA